VQNVFVFFIDKNCNYLKITELFSVFKGVLKKMRIGWGSIEAVFWNEEAYF